MIHAVIFANREQGNQLYERTQDFPGGAADRIREICLRHGVPDSLGNTDPVLRYQPLDGRFLLTVIFRMPAGSAVYDQESRAHVVCVNFLMDAPEADRFFRIPFHQVAPAVVQTSRELLEFQGRTISRNVCGSFLRLAAEDAMPCRGKTPLAILMMGACHSLEIRQTKQLYLQSSHPAAEELHNLLRILPPPLRKQLSFHTGCVSAAECQELGVCYCHDGTLSGILASDFKGGSRTTKYWYFADGSNQGSRIDDQNRMFVNRLIQIPEAIPMYDLLRDAVTDWDTYRELSLLVSGRPKLAQVLELLPEENVLRIIRSGKAGELQLAQLAKAAGAGSPIRKAAKAARKGAAVNPDSRRNDSHISAANVFHSVKRLLQQNRGRLMLILCLLDAVLNYPAVANGTGDDLVREILCFAGFIGTGFFMSAILPSTGTTDPDGEA